MLLAAAEEPSWLEFLWTCFLVLIGVNMLIIVHEWGHFIVARACGVRCDKFYIWFDAWGFKFFKFKWGDTEYGLGWLPLGGYVKMLGQEDNPAHMQEELERAKKHGYHMEHEEAEAESPEAEPKGATAEAPKPETPTLDAESKPAEESGDEGEAGEELTEDELHHIEDALYAEDSYLSKKVWQRAAIIAAGVTMNVVFAFVCAMGAYILGVYKPVCEIGGVTPGDAAWRAGLQSGDVVTEIDGKPADIFNDILRAVAIGDVDDGVEFTIERTRQGAEPEHLTFNLQPDRENRLAPTIGAYSSHILKIRDTQPGTPAHQASPKIESGDVLIAVNGEELAEGEYGDFRRIEKLHRTQPLTFTVKRVKEESKEKALKTPKELTDSDYTTLDVTVQPRKVRRVGIVVGMGPIQAVQTGSPAAKAGLQAGDVIEKCDGSPIADPMHWPEELQEMAQAAGDEPTTVELTYRRGKETKTVQVQLKAADWDTQLLHGDNPWECAPIGVAYKIDPVVKSVIPDSPAAKAGIKPGQRITSIQFLAPSEELLKKYGEKEWSEGKAIELKAGKVNWPFLFDRMQDSTLPGQEIEIELASKDKSGEEELTKYKVVPVEAENWYDSDRGLLFEAKTIFFQADGVGAAFSYATEETLGALSMVTRFLQKLSTQQVSMKGLGGPVTIVSMAYHHASADFGTYLLFLCLLSANLAVVNVLPIPVLDGGHLVFLAYEGITGRPPNEKLQIILSYAGLILLLTLMIWLLGLDFKIIPRQ